METITANYTDNQTVKECPDRYTLVRVDTKSILKSWKSSLFSFEWLDQNGEIRALDDLPMNEHEKRLNIEKKLGKGEALPCPVLGIGVLENVEIGVGRDVFLTLAAKGFAEIEVYIPKSCEGEFKKFVR